VSLSALAVSRLLTRLLLAAPAQRILMQGNGRRLRRPRRLLEAVAETKRCMGDRRRAQTLGLGPVLGRIKAAGLLSLTWAAQISRRAARSCLVRPAGVHWLVNWARFSRRGRTRSSLVRLHAATPRDAGSLGSRRGGIELGSFRSRGHQATGEKTVPVHKSRQESDKPGAGLLHDQFDKQLASGAVKLLDR